MKRVFLLIAMVAGLSGLANAQLSNHKTLGLHLGNATEVSYQHPLSESNRLEFNLGISSWGNSFTGINGLHQWVWDLSDLANGFNWYLGAGVGIGSKSGAFAAAVLGQIGIEYDLLKETDVPLLISLDYRPDFLLIPGAETRFEVVGVGIRYKF